MQSSSCHILQYKLYFFEASAKNIKNRSYSLQKRMLKRNFKLSFKSPSFKPKNKKVIKIVQTAWREPLLFFFYL